MKRNYIRELLIFKQQSFMKAILKDFEKNKNIASSKDRIRSLIKKGDKIYLLETTKTDAGTLSNLYTIFWDWDGAMVCESRLGTVMSSDNGKTILIEHDRAFFYLTEKTTE